MGTGTRTATATAAGAGDVTPAPEPTGPVPRYLLPDYARLLARGSHRLGRGPARTPRQALDLLLAAYSALPAQAGTARALGRLDVLLAPVLPAPGGPQPEGPQQEGPQQDGDLDRLLATFWRRLHALAGPGYVTVGPGDGPVARSLLRIAAVPVPRPAPGRGYPPRVVLRVDPEATPDGLLSAALAIPDAAGGPLLAADGLRPAGIGADHALADAGIRLPEGGGAYGLVRFDLLAAVLQHRGSVQEYLDRTLPAQLDQFTGLLAARTARSAARPDALAGYWPATEGLLHRERFGAAFVVTGVAEAAARLAGDDGDAAAVRALRARITECVTAVAMPHCTGGHGRAWLNLPSGLPGELDAGGAPTSSAVEVVDLAAAGGPAGPDGRAAAGPRVRAALAGGVATCTVRAGGRQRRRVTGFLARERSGLAADPGPEAGGYVAGTVECSTIDGPGRRFVAFLQGCGYDCLSCHNPCSIPAAPAGMRRTAVADLVASVRPLAAGLDGVTVSGGEATAQAPFVRSLFAALQADPVTARLSRFVDSNGDTDPETWRLLAPVTDGMMLDLKALDDEMHVVLTGASNRRCLASIRTVAELGLLVEVRLLLVPGLNDSDPVLRRTAGWLLDVAPGLRVVVNPFRRSGTRACARDLLEPRPDDLRRYREVLTAAGITDLHGLDPG